MGAVTHSEWIDKLSAEGGASPYHAPWRVGCPVCGVAAGAACQNLYSSEVCQAREIVWRAMGMPKENMETDPLVLAMWRATQG